MRSRSENNRRPGVAAVEVALVMLVFLTLVLGMIDLGVGMFRYHAVAEAARMGARQVIVHGPGSPGNAPIDPWTAGDAANNVLSGDGVNWKGIGSFLQAASIPTDPNPVTVTYNGTSIGSSVQVTVTTLYQPSMSFIFSQPIQLSATATMIIAH